MWNSYRHRDMKRSKRKAVRAVRKSTKAKKLKILMIRSQGLSRAKSGPRRSQRKRKQPDWYSYSSMAEFAYSIVSVPLTFDEVVESSDKKKWRVSMDEEIDAHHRNKTWKLVL